MAGRQAGERPGHPAGSGRGHAALLEVSAFLPSRDSKGDLKA